MAIEIDNTSTYEGKLGETDWWQWTAYIKCTPPDSLDAIEYVEYILHPSFTSPVKIIRRKEGGFPLSTRGWGPFYLNATVYFMDKNRNPMPLKPYLLKFESPPGG
jgi:transcription initiation factor IIF auxiliary subunit